VPGPGTYDGDKLKKENFKYSMGSKLDNDKSNNNPGPGLYETRTSLDGAPTSKFGTSKRDGLVGKVVSPGPG